MKLPMTERKLDAHLNKLIDIRTSITCNFSHSLMDEELETTIFYLEKAIINMEKAYRKVKLHNKRLDEGEELT